MRAVLYEAFQQLAEVVTVDDPPCPETGVVIEVAATGLAEVTGTGGWATTRISDSHTSLAMNSPA